MRAVFAVVCLAVAAQAASLHQHEWEAFKLQYKRQFADAVEDAQRFKIFTQNMRKIERHNGLYERGLYSYRLGVTQFADLTHEEFLAQQLGQISVSTPDLSEVPSFSPHSSDLPDSVDWRDQGVVTPVRNSGSVCSPTYAISSTESIESAHAIAEGELRTLSTQNIIDCSQSYGNDGCTSGNFVSSFRYVIANNGIDSAFAYPSTGTEEPCKFDEDGVAATISDYANVTQGDEGDLQAAVANSGPVSVLIDASLPSFQLYTSGVYSDPRCSSSLLDHAVVVVGYGTEKTQDYWIVKNSWGPSWGEDGYIRIARNENNMCGIASEASYPIV